MVGERPSAGATAWASVGARCRHDLRLQDRWGGRFDENRRRRTFCETTGRVQSEELPLAWLHRVPEPWQGLASEGRKLGLPSPCFSLEVKIVAGAA